MCIRDRMARRYWNIMQDLVIRKHRLFFHVWRMISVSYTHLDVYKRQIILSGFSISLTVEVIQLITRVGCFDVDDMILNTLGAALGYGIYAVCDKIRRKH